MSLKTEITTKGSASLKPKDWKQIFKDQLLKMGNTWHDLFFPRRFGDSGKNIYHLRQRSVKYVKKMQKLLHGSWKPLMKTASMGRVMITNASIKPKTAGNKLEVDIKMKRPHATQRFVSEELVKVNNNELELLMKEFTVNSISESAKAPQKKV